MSIRQMQRVWEIEVDHPEQSVLMVLANHADDDGGSVFPSVARIGWTTGYSERSVQYIIRRLVEARLIEVVAPPTFVKPTEYRLTLENGVPKTPFAPKRGAKFAPPQVGVQSATLGVQNGARGGATATAPDPSVELDPSVEPSAVHPPTPLDLQNLWNEIVQTPRVDEMRGRRAQATKKRLGEHADFAWWRQVMERVVATPFLRGNGTRGWRADFDWLIGNELNAVKVLEGKYDDAKPTGYAHGAQDGRAGNPVPDPERTRDILRRIAGVPDPPKGVIPPHAELTE